MHHHHLLHLAVALLALVSACDPPEAEDNGRRRRDDDEDPAGEDCRDDDDCRGGEICDDDRCVASCVIDDSCEGAEGEGELPAEGEGEGELPAEGEGEGELPAEGEGEGELPAEGEGEGEGEGEASGVITFELQWSQTTTDLDLHLNRATPPAWCTADDCDYEDTSTSWGARLVDSLDGAVPEVITLTNPADGTYTLAVGAYKGTVATDALLLVTHGSRTLYQDFVPLVGGDTWQPLSIRVSNGVVTLTVINSMDALDGGCFSNGL